MDDESLDLIERLLVKAASIMEDASAASLLRGGTPIEQRVAAAISASSDVSALGAAAAVLLRLRN